MNLLEHYVKEIHSVADITEEFSKHCGYIPDESLLRVNLTEDCYGITKRTTKSFWQSDFETIKKQGYYMG